MENIKYCTYCGTPFSRESRGGNFNRAKLCGNACALAARKHTPEQALAEFWARVQKTDTCWLWIGAKRWDGYGRVNRNGKQTTAHRHSWELANGPIAIGLGVLHTCDTPACVNPAHLRVGTHAENMADMRAKKRGTIGEKSKSAKLTEEQAKRILSLKGQASAKDLASEYGLNQTAISAIWRGDAWRHIHEQ